MKSSQKTWTTKDGQVIQIKDMTTNHLVNTIKMLKKSTKVINKERQIKFNRQFVDSREYPGQLPDLTPSQCWDSYQFLVEELKTRKIAKLVLSLIS